MVASNKSGVREREGAGYKTVPESLIRAIKPELLLAKVHSIKLRHVTIFS